MGNKVGHILLGVAYLLVGSWHLFNHTKLHASSHPNSYTSRTWFPMLKSKYLELFSIMGACTIYVTMMLFVSPDRHQPLDADGTIPSYHLHTFEHTLIAMTFFTYAALSILLHKSGPNKTKNDLTQLLAAIAFAQQLLLFHFHSTDHTGVEGQYHLMLQILTFVSLTTTLIGIGYPKSFLISFLRSASIMFQGLWMIVLGYMVWTPGVIPRGCFLNLEDGHYVVKCHSDRALHRAKSLVNIMFSCFVIILTSFTIAFYMVIVKRYGNNLEYQSLVEEVELEDGDYDDDVDTKRKNGNEESTNFRLTGKLAPVVLSVDMER